MSVSWGYIKKRFVAAAKSFSPWTLPWLTKLDGHLMPLLAVKTAVKKEAVSATLRLEVEHKRKQIDNIGNMRH